MTSFFPQLVLLIDFMRSFEEFQLLQHPALATSRKKIDDLAGGERFESTNLLAQVWSRCDQMEMVFEDDVAEQLEALVALQEAPGIENEFNGLWACEHRQPANDGAGEKMRGVGIVRIDAIAATGHGGASPESFLGIVIERALSGK